MEIPEDLIARIRHGILTLTGVDAQEWATWKPTTVLYAVYCDEEGTIHLVTGREEVTRLVNALNCLEGNFHPAGIPGGLRAGTVFEAPDWFYDGLPEPTAP